MKCSVSFDVIGGFPVLAGFVYKIWDVINWGQSGTNEFRGAAAALGVKLDCALLISERAPA